MNRPDMEVWKVWRVLLSHSYRTRLKPFCQRDGKEERSRTSIPSIEGSPQAYREGCP